MLRRFFITIIGSPTPPRQPPDGTTMDSTFGVAASSIEPGQVLMISDNFVELLDGNPPLEG